MSCESAKNLYWCSWPSTKTHSVLVFAIVDILDCVRIRDEFVMISQFLDELCVLVISFELRYERYIDEFFMWFSLAVVMRFLAVGTVCHFCMRPNKTATGFHAAIVKTGVKVARNSACNFVTLNDDISTLEQLVKGIIGHMRFCLQSKMPQKSEIIIREFLS
jgi:hypothetical protein